MDIALLTHGTKVTLYGLCYTVLRIEDNKVRVKPWRGYGGWKVVTPDELAPWEPKAKVSNHARTCQICGRPIHAATGTIAHHGYERPGNGWQTQSCPGAKHLPFEQSRDELTKRIANLKDWSTETRAAIAQLETGTQTVHLLETKYDARGRMIYGANDKPERTLNTYKPGDDNYPRALRAAIGLQQQTLKSYELELDFQQPRWTNWKPKKK